MVSVAADSRNGYKLVPTKEDSTGVSLDSEFVFESEDVKVTPKELVDGLKINEGLEFYVEKSGEDQYKIKLKEDLKKNSIYRFIFTDSKGIETSWVYQTVMDFSVLGTLPADKSSEVPTNSGIEIYFSHSNLKDVEKYIKVSPEVNGKFETNGRTIIFVPKELKPATLYTITIDKEIHVKNSEQKLSEDFVFQFETGTEKYDEKNNYYFSYFRTMFEFSSNEDILMPINYYNGKDVTNLPVNTKVYSFKNYEEFVGLLEAENNKPVWAYYNAKKYVPNTKELDEVMDFEYTLPKSYNYSNPPQIELPERLDKGAYLVLSTYDDYSFYTFVQVTDLAVYSTIAENGLLFWVNNIDNKKPVQGASIKIESQKGITDSKGIVKLNPVELDENTWVKYATITSDEEKCVVPIMSSTYRLYNQGDNISSNYWTYMHLDRNLYKPSDSVNIWGFVKNRYDSSEFKELTIEVSEGGYWFYDYGKIISCFPFVNEPLVSKKVKVDGNFYEGKLDLPALSEGSYNISVKSGDKTISTQYFTIQNYTKPAYKLSVTKDKKALFVGDTINFEVKASFFEGTSLPDLLVNYEVWSTSSTRSKKTTNDDGLIKLSYTPNYDSSRQGEVYGNINAFANLPESGEIYVNENFRVFNNDINVKTIGKIENENKAILEINMNEIDLTKINEGTDEEYNDYLGKVITGRQISGTLYKNYYEKIETGEEYDYINKIVRKTYEYRPKKDKIKDFTATTDKEGKINLSFDLKDTTECYYTATFTTKDNNNRKMNFDVWFSEGYSPYDNQHPRLTFDKEKYNIDEEVSVTFENVESDKDNNYLYILSQKGILSHVTTKEAKYNFKFQSRHIPNVNITGVYFNGKTYIYTYADSIRYDYENSKLTINASSNKESYKPGETCNIDLVVTDKDGKPVSGVVNAAIVDEALLALSDMEYHVLENLYTNIESGIYSSYSTHRADQNGNIGIRLTGRGIMEESAQYAMDDGSMKKNADSVIEEAANEVSARDKFLDVALFKSVELNKEGKGTISFDLPDNVTSWRVSMVGITKDLHGGSDVVNLTVSLPFFINSSLNENYLVGDYPYIGVTAYGDGVSKGDKVKYEVTSPQNDNFKQSFEGDIYERINIPLFKLSEDKYDVIVTARSGKHSDSVKYTLNTSKTYKTITVSEYNKASENMNIPAGTSGLTEVIFTNEGRGKYLPDLYSLAFSYGNRIDQKLVSKDASMLLETFNKKMKNDEEYNFSAYQKEDGGLSLLPYSSSDILVTVDNLTIITDEFNIPRIKAYLYTKLQDGITFEKTAAVYGLSLTKEPILADVEKIKELKDIDFKGYIYLALAYSELGDNYMAEKIYNEEIKPYVEEYEDYARVIYSEGKDETYELTTMTAYLLSKINNPNKTKLFSYVNKNYSTKILVDNYKLAYIKNEFNKIAKEPIDLKYEYDGEEYDVKLTDIYSKAISIPSQKIKDLKILSTTNNVGVISVYEKQLTDLSNADSNISISRKYYDIDGKAKTTFKEGDIVKVVIKYDIKESAIDDYYKITDYLPSGIKPLENHYNFSGENYYYGGNIDGQKVSFYVYKNNKEKKPLVYYGRIVSLGEYKGDEAIIQGQIVKDSMNYTESSNIKIVE